MICNNQRGQLLVEVLVAITVGGIFILGATTAIISVLKNNYETRSSQTLSSVALDLSNRVASLASSNWHDIYDLAHGSTTHYFVVSGATSSLAVQGEEGAMFDDIETGLVGRWGFDEATGTTAYDTSGGFDHGTLINNPSRTASSSCQVGSCLTFSNAADTYIDTGTTTGKLVSASAFSVSLWFNASQAMAAFQGLISKDQSSPYVFSIRRQGTGNNIEVTMSGDNLDTTLAPVAGIWYHLVLTMDSSGRKVYINGGNEGVPNASDAYAIPPPDNGDHLYIGLDYLPGNSRAFTGKIDDVRIYNRALSSFEVQQLYENASYQKYFYVENVERDGSGTIVASGGTDDPSTQKIISNVEWGEGRSASLVAYVTRNRNEVFEQSDWSGGDGQEGPITSVNDQYSSAQNISAGTSLILADNNAEGMLYSSTLDTQIEGGAAFNSLVWQGSKPSGTNVKFQIASSNSSSGGGGSATGTIDSIYKYAWNDYIGWIDFGYGPGSVEVQDSQLLGYAYNDDVGEISFDCATSPAGDVCAASNYKVSRATSTGDLSGWAWNDEIGWISFCGGESSADCPGTVSYKVNVNPTTGYFSGWAWNDYVGWISFDCGDVGLCGVSDYKVAVSGASGWRYLGPDGTSLTYYVPTSAGVSSQITLRYHNNHRYFRYKVILAPDSGNTTTPSVESISVNWSP